MGSVFETKQAYDTGYAIGERITHRLTQHTVNRMYSRINRRMRGMDYGVRWNYFLGLCDGLIERDGLVDF